MSHIANNITVVCYDISNDRLRNKIDKCMKDFGKRFQRSVYVCRLSKDDVNRCKTRLQELLAKFERDRAQDDSLVVFELQSANSLDCLLGVSIAKNEPNYVVL